MLEHAPGQKRFVGLAGAEQKVRFLTQEVFQVQQARDSRRCFSGFSRVVFMVIFHAI
jgi:hypothetical protein